MKQIPLTQGKVAVVDDSDFEWLNQWKWCAHKGKHCWYAKRTSAGILMHRVIMDAQKGQQIDHHNGIGLDNQRHNLRFCTQSQNSYNQKKTKGASQFKGVTWDKTNKKWRAKICIDNKHIHLGRFSNEIDAAIAYNYKARELFGEYAKLNEVA